MKIIHTADWHLGNVFHTHQRIAEHQHFLQWLLAQLKAQQPDALIISGDIFDSPNPSAQAEELLYQFLMDATSAVSGLQIVLLAGNHDSGNRLEAPAALLKAHNVYVKGTVPLTEKGEPDFDQLILPLSSRTDSTATCVCLTIPYLRGADYPAGYTPEQGMDYYFRNLLQRVKKSDFKGLPIIAAAHFYTAGAEIANDEHSERLVVGGADCIDTRIIPNALCYTALGHIHKAQAVKSSRAVYYAGSALPMSFSECAYQHGVQLIELTDTGDCSVERLPYQPLRRLISIPSQGRSVSVSEAFEAISALPKRDKSDGYNWPYLELRIKEQQPEPALLHQIVEALADRAVHLCRVLRIQPNVDTTSANKKSADSLPSLQTLRPVQLARQFYQSRYDTDMPQPLIERLQQAEQRALDFESDPSVTTNNSQED